MTNLKKPKYTLVQHSGFGYAGKPGFEHGVESRTLTTQGEVTKVRKAGGLIFDSGFEADEMEEKINYGESTSMLYPNAKGTFSTEKIDGLAIYIPVREVVG